MPCNLGGIDLKVATWNIYLGADIMPIVAEELVGTRHDRVRRFAEQVRDTRFPDRARAIAAAVGKTAPDVIGLQEVVRYTNIRAGDVELIADHLQTLLAALEVDGEPFSIVAKAETYTAEYPLSDSAYLGFQNFDVILARAAALASGKLTFLQSGSRVYSTCEPATPGAVDRSGWVYADLLLDRRIPFRFHETHLEAGSADVRLLQARELAAASGAHPHASVVVGDLNTTAADGVLEAFGEVGLQDAWPHGIDAGPTWRQRDDLRGCEPHLQRLDYVLADTSLVTTLEARLMGAAAEERTTTEPRLWPSDHAGVAATLRVSGLEVLS